MITEPYQWDWQDDPPTYLVRQGEEVVCTTNRFKSGYERAKAIAEQMNVAAHIGSPSEAPDNGPHRQT